MRKWVPYITSAHVYMQVETKRNKHVLSKIYLPKHKIHVVILFLPIGTSYITLDTLQIN